MIRHITLISDTHAKHDQITNDLPGGDLIIHAGDFMTTGQYESELVDFLTWYQALSYRHKVLVAGNHDCIFDSPRRERALQLVADIAPSVTYLQDQSAYIDGLVIYGSPWQPEFYNWAFNLPRNGQALKAKWAMIPKNIDILVCHTMPWGYGDYTSGENVGCELLRERVNEVKPKLFVGGHIHSGSGQEKTAHTRFVNASVLDNEYCYTNKPTTLKWEELRA